MPFWEVAICVSMKDRPSGRNPPSSNRLKITMKTAVTKGEHRLWRFLHPQLIFYRLWLLQSEQDLQFGELSISWKDTEMTIPELMLMYGKEASNRKQEIDRQHHTIPNKRTKDKHYGNVHNRLWNHG